MLTYHMVAPVVASEPLQSQLRQRGEREAFVVGEDDGLIKTNIYFQLNMNGYFEFQVSVNDSVAGRGDVASISVSRHLTTPFTVNDLYCLPILSS